MKNPELYHKTVNILVDAYFNDTLQHGNCQACAVGNIVAANMGISLFKNTYGKICWSKRNLYMWYDCFLTSNEELNLDALQNIEVSRQVIASGYSIFEIQKIEKAFERSKKYNSGDKMFDDLMAVIEVLDEIHENKDEEVTVNSKNKFNKQSLVSQGLKTDGVF